MSNSAVRVGIACFIWKNDKFLMMQRQGSHGTGSWSIPGGHLEIGENWEDCAKRETLEETGMHIQNTQLLAVTNDIFAAENKHYVTIWLNADWLDGEPAILEPNKCMALEWRTFQSLPSPLFEPCWQNLKHIHPELFS